MQFHACSLTLHDGLHRRGIERTLLQPRRAAALSKTSRLSSATRSSRPVLSFTACIESLQSVHTLQLPFSAEATAGMVRRTQLGNVDADSGRLST